MRIFQLFFILSFVIATACSGPKESEPAEETTSEEMSTAEEAPSAETPVIMVHEEKFHHNETETHLVRKTEEAADESVEMPAVVGYTDLHDAMLENDYAEVTSETTNMAIIPLDETETVISYNKKDKEKAVVQVVRDGNGEIQQIMFADKNHRDIYDVSTGMTAKEAKSLRKDLKHMIHRGHHFLYDDQSNIMYLLEEEKSDGTEVLEAEIDQMEVRAIVWKHGKKE